MKRRTSSVNRLDIIDVSTTSVVEIGDSVCLVPVNHSLAVQRERAIFWENEFVFDRYPIFGMEIPQPPLYEQLEIQTLNISPFILVNDINVSFVAASAVVHIGSSDKIGADSRVKHIRHLLREKP